MSVFGAAGDGGAAAQEKARQARIAQGQRDVDRQFSGFTSDFYDKAASDYTSSVMPEVWKDYQTTKNNLTYALARSGIMKSGAAVNRTASLNNALSVNESKVANAALDQENQLRARVSSQKGNLLNQLESSADPTSISLQAQGAVSQLRAPSPIQPLGNLFADWTNMYLANKTANAYQQPNIWDQLGNSGYGTVGSGGGGGSAAYVQ